MKRENTTLHMTLQTKWSYHIVLQYYTMSRVLQYYFSLCIVQLYTAQLFLSCWGNFTFSGISFTLLVVVYNCVKVRWTAYLCSWRQLPCKYGREVCTAWSQQQQSWWLWFQLHSSDILSVSCFWVVLINLNDFKGSLLKQNN